MKDRIGVAIVGCGYWGVNYVRVFNELADSDVVALCDTRPERFGELKRHFPSAQMTTEIGDILANPAVDAVVICTEATSHFKIARQFIRSGRHVLIEKPITTVSWQAEELISLAENAHTVLMVGHTFLYNAGIRKIHEYLMEPGTEIYYLHSRRTNLGPIRRDVNAIWDLATHDIAIFNYLMGTVPEWVSAIGSKVLHNCKEDVGFLTLCYPGGVIGHIHVSWADPNKAREVVVVCSDRRIVFNDLAGLEQVRVFEKGIRPMNEQPESYGEYRLQIRDGDVVSPKIELAEPLKTQCRHFLECVKAGSKPLTGGEGGCDVLRVLEAVDSSMKFSGAQTEVLRNAVYAA